MIVYVMSPCICVTCEGNVNTEQCCKRGKELEMGARLLDFIIFRDI